MSFLKTKLFWARFLQALTVALIIYFSVFTIVHMPYSAYAPEIQMDFTNYFWGHDIAPPITLQVDYKKFSSDDWNMIARSTQKEIKITVPEHEAFYRITVNKTYDDLLSKTIIKSHSLVGGQIISSYEDDDFIVYEFTTRKQNVFANDVVVFRVN